MKPLVSVLMPVREPGPYLSEAVNSILAQTLGNFELLLVGYPDITHWADLLPDDPRISILQRDRPGIIAALNTGLAAAKGQFIARMDADDISVPERFETQLDYLQSNPSINIAGARVQLYNPQAPIQEGNRAYQQWLNALCEPESIVANLFVESPLPHPTLFAARSVFNQLQGYAECTWAEDYDFLLRAHLAGYAMGKPERILLQWREHAERLTYTDVRYSRLNFTRAKAWALSQTFAQNRPVIICGIGRNAVRLCDALHEYGVAVVCFVEQDEAPRRSSRRKLPVITYSELHKYKQDALVVTAVTARGARDKLRVWFESAGWQELSDYVIAG